MGICVIHCARERSKKKRIQKRELLKATDSALPYVEPKVGSSADILSDRSSVMFSDGPSSDAPRPSTRGTLSPVEAGDHRRGNSRTGNEEVNREASNVI